jgi:hypothetical protein
LNEISVSRSASFSEGRKQKEREEVWRDEEKKTTRRDESDDTDIK